MSLQAKYEPGEKLLCFHGPLIYEAKCLDVKIKDDNVMYFVHYQGWNKNWDEWVTDKRMFKYNEENLKKQKDLERQIKSGKRIKMLKKSELKTQSMSSSEVPKVVEEDLRSDEIKEEPLSPKPKQTRLCDEADELKTDTTGSNDIKDSESIKSSTTYPDESNPLAPNPIPVSSRRRKGRITGISTLENDDGFLTRPQLNIDMPSSLKAWLVDDWDLITRQARLYELPASQTISSLMTEFLEQVEIKTEPNTNELNTSSDSQNSHVNSNISPRITPDLKHEFVAGLKHYFNLIIGSQLLYKFERLQYAELLKRHTDKKMSDIYGPIHLLRLFIKLRDMVSCTKVDPTSLPTLESLVCEFLLFLKHNQKRYFQLEYYTVATAEYQRRAMC